MKLIIDELAAKQLAPHFTAGKQLILDMDDGDGPFAQNRISCQLNPYFRLLVVTDEQAAKKDLSLYQEQVTTEWGAMRIKRSALMYLDDPSTITMDAATGVLQLKGPYSGILQANLSLVEWE